MDIKQLALDAGFTSVYEFNPEILKARQDVRAMCEEDSCHAYGKNWTCPPFCGTVDECQAKMLKYKHGLLLQTTGELAKRIDIKGYYKVGDMHNEHTYALFDKLKELGLDYLMLGGGGCRRCKECAYPDPCRFPDMAIASMEGYGLLVSEVCRDAGAKYYYGEKTITYCACVLYND